MKTLEVEKLRLEESIMHMQTARARRDPGDDDSYIICATCTAAKVHNDIICYCGRGGRVCNCQNFKTGRIPCVLKLKCVNSTEALSCSCSNWLAGN